MPEGPLPPIQMRRPLATQVTPSASFLATTKMAINAGQAQGMQVDNGADMVLRHVAEHEGKPVAGLETLESQLACSRAWLRPPMPTGRWSTSGGTATPATVIAKSMADMQSAWKRGDQSVFVNMLGQLEPGFAGDLQDAVHRSKWPLGRLGRGALANARHSVRRCRRGPSRRPGQPPGPAGPAGAGVPPGQLTASKLAFPRLLP